MGSLRRGGSGLRSRATATDGRLIRDHLAALVLRRDVAAMADVGADIENRLHLLAVEELFVVGDASVLRVVFAAHDLYLIDPGAGEIALAPPGLALPP